MKAIVRNIDSQIRIDLNKKFVFLSGPRQVGKTTYAKALMKSLKGKYLVYDDEEDRNTILKKLYIQETFVCLDEFHKYDRWKSHIKGVFDKYHENLHLILTGSARLDIYQKSGDSLLGRYYLHHLHPFSLGELEGAKLKSMPEDIFYSKENISLNQDLLRFGGFPEPFFSGTDKEHTRWSILRRNLIIREDLRDLSEIKMLSLVEHLMLLLPEKIGQPFSFRSLAQDIQTSSPTIQNWMNMFEKLFIVYKLRPYSYKISRSIQRQPKYYFWDWSQVKDEGARYENFIASHLFKACQIWTDIGEGDFSLQYIRDRDQREVDFLILKNEKPWLLVEAKLSDTIISPSLKLFSDRLAVPAIQLVWKKGINKHVGNISVISASGWLLNLP